MKRPWMQAYSQVLTGGLLIVLLSFAIERLSHGATFRQAFFGRMPGPWWLKIIPTVSVVLMAALHARWLKKVITAGEDTRALRWILNAAYDDMQPNGVCGDVHDAGGVRKILGDYLDGRGWRRK